MKNEIRGKSDQRSFVMVYHDFLESNKLSGYEKLVYICLKRYADNVTGQAFPSVARLHQMTGLSVNFVRKALHHMEKLGVLTIESRKDKNGDNYLSNLYTLHDYRSMWSGDHTEPTEEDLEQHYIDVLRAKGYLVEKKVPTSSGQGKIVDTLKEITSGNQYKDNSKKSQSSKNRFKNFPERDYSIDTYNALEIISMNRPE